jgi:hypothetical protein
MNQTKPASVAECVHRLQDQLWMSSVILQTFEQRSLFAQMRARWCSQDDLRTAVSH